MSYQRPPRAPGHVSGQLDDTELALESRVKETLNAPRFKADSMTPSLVGYSMLKEELEMRSLRNRDLRAQQDLAFNSSARRRMHDTALDNDQQSQTAKEAFNRMPQMLGSGLTKAEIKNQLFREDPSLATNKFFLQGAKGFDLLAQTENERFLAANAEKIAEFTSGSDLTAAKIGYAEAEVKETYMEQFKESVENYVKAGFGDAESKLLESNIQNLQKHHEYQQATTGNGAMILASQRFGEDFSISSMDHGRMMNNFTKMGVHIQDPNLFSKHGPTSKIQMQGLGSQAAMAMVASTTGANPRDVNNSIGDLSDPAVHEAAEAGDTDAIKKLATARGYVSRAGSAFTAIYDDQIKEAAVKERNSSIYKNLFKTRADLARGYKTTADIINNTLKDQSGVELKGLGGATEQAVKDHVRESNSVARTTATNYIESLIVSKGKVASTSINTAKKRKMILAAGAAADTEQFGRMGEAELDVIGADKGLWVNIPHAPNPHGQSMPEYKGKIILWLDAMTQSFQPVASEYPTETINSGAADIFSPTKISSDDDLGGGAVDDRGAVAQGKATQKASLEYMRSHASEYGVSFNPEEMDQMEEQIAAGEAEEREAYIDSLGKSKTGVENPANTSYIPALK